MRLSGFWIGLLGLVVYAQCLTVPEQSYFLSDRYVDAKASGNNLILANSYGLIFRDLNDAQLPITHAEVVPGDLEQLEISEGFLFAMTPDSGVFIYRIQASGLPELISFLSVPGIQTFAVSGLHLYVGAGLLIERYDMDAPLDTPIAQYNLPYEIRKMVPFADGLVLHGKDGRLGFFPLQTPGANPLTAFEWEGDTFFYNVYPFQDGLLIDAPKGIVVASYDGRNFSLETQIHNQGVQIVLGMACDQERLFVRFSKLLVEYRLVNGTLREMARTPVVLSELRFPKMTVIEGDLVLLNQSPVQRSWSLAKYQSQGTNLTRQVFLPSLVDNVDGLAQIGDTLFVALDSVLRFGRIGSGDNAFASFQSLDLNNPILSLTASQDLIFVLIAQPLKDSSTLQVFQLDGGGLNLVFNRDFLGTLDQFHTQNNLLSFTQFFRDAEQDHFIAKAFSFELNPDQPTEHSLEYALPVGSANPLYDVNVDLSGFWFHDGISLYYAPFDGEAQRINVPGEGFEIKRLALQDEMVFLEHSSGLRLLRRQNTRLELLGEYPLWHQMTQTRNGLILARSKLNFAGGVFWVLDTQDDLLSPMLRLNGSKAPSYVGFLGDQLVSAEPTSVNLFQVECQTSQYHYLFPFNERYILEYNTHLSASDWVKFSIFNSANRLIGTQILDKETLGLVQEKKLRDIFLDFNALETPFRFTIDSTFPLQPLLSFQSKNEPPGYALRIPTLRGGSWFCPHVGAQAQGWNTRVLFTGDSPSSSMEASFLDEDLNEVNVPFTTGYGEERQVQQVFGKEVRYFTFQPKNLTDSVAGFVVFERDRQQGQAGVNLFQRPSEFFVVPHLVGDPVWWTGLVLTNPNPNPVRVRLLGYDSEGRTSVDRNIDIDAHDRFVGILEEYLQVYAQGLDVQWITVVSEAPIFGLGLIGHYFDASLAGFELTTENQNQLIFSGVAENELRWVRLVVVNREARDGDMVFSAYDAFGNLLAQKALTLGRRQKVYFSPESLFDLSPLELRQITTIQVDSVTDVTGLLLRGENNSRQIDAISIVD
ncbi:MAG: hypothetical protein H6510_04390 [Acidobacteria bacterium]|nr:hypothetical protein [Acidobacteriota bacterium]MCB9397036.1 hypothetical protein [Acidobacteriota bacterium]